MIALLCLSLCFAQVERLRDVKIIYVGNMGQSDEAERFRLLLEDELSKRGFTVTDKEEKADAILSGILAVRVYDEMSVARATVRLKNQSGTILWSGDFQRKFSWRAKSDTVKFRAETIASDLRKAKEKDTKRN